MLALAQEIWGYRRKGSTCLQDRRALSDALGHLEVVGPQRRRSHDHRHIPYPSVSKTRSALGYGSMGINLAYGRSGQVLACAVAPSAPAGQAALGVSVTTRSALRAAARRSRTPIVGTLPPASSRETAVGHARSLGELALGHAELEPAGAHGLAEFVGALGRLVAGAYGFAVPVAARFPSHMFTHY